MACPFDPCLIFIFIFLLYERVLYSLKTCILFYSQKPGPIKGIASFNGASISVTESPIAVKVDEKLSITYSCAAFLQYFPFKGGPDGDVGAIVFSDKICYLCARGRRQSNMDSVNKFFSKALTFCSCLSSGN